MLQINPDPARPGRGDLIHDFARFFFFSRMLYTKVPARVNPSKFHVLTRHRLYEMRLHDWLRVLWLAQLVLVNVLYKIILTTSAASSTNLGSILIITAKMAWCKSFAPLHDACSSNAAQLDVPGGRVRRLYCCSVTGPPALWSLSPIRAERV